MTGPRLFAVISWGASGTMWLTRVLNAHAEVLCLHSLARQLNRRFGRSLDDLTYLRSIEHQASAYRLAGDVHGIDLHGLGQLRNAFGERLRVATLVRHPVPRVASQWAVLEDRGLGFYRLPYRRIRWSLPRSLRSRYGDREKLFFVHVMSLVNRVVLEGEVGPVYTLERLSSEVEAVQELLDYLSAGELEFSDAVLASVWGQRVNTHVRPSERRDAPKEAFAGLPVWQQEAFAELLEPEARARYEALGHDLSFV